MVPQNSTKTPLGILPERIRRMAFIRRIIYQELTPKIFDNLKIRASYGVMGDDQFLDSSGNPQVLPFQYLTGYNYPGGTNYIFGSDVVNSLITKGLANTEYSWIDIQDTKCRFRCIFVES